MALEAQMVMVAQRGVLGEVMRVETEVEAVVAEEAAVAAPEEVRVAECSTLGSQHSL